jgi:DNA gyrase subunit A
LIALDAGTKLSGLQRIVENDAAVTDAEDAPDGSPDGAANGNNGSVNEGDTENGDSAK